MIYWEVMASCLIDQEIGALSYLDVFSALPLTTFCYPCPWTGVGTNILIHLAKCITLVRQRRRLILCNSPMGRNMDVSSHHLDLLTQAFSLSLDIDQCQIPSPIKIQDTGDYRTPADHLSKIAQCYQLVARLELDRAFPELTPDLQNDQNQDGLLAYHILELAVEVLEIMNTIPEGSRTIAIQTIILLAAGSALGFSSSEDTNFKMSVTGWRRFVLERLHKSFMTLKLQTINRVAIVLQEVWAKMDSAAMAVPDSASYYKSPILRVHWINVMTEAGLETILG
jgi:hypothetical protein